MHLTVSLHVEQARELYIKVTYDGSCRRKDGLTYTQPGTHKHTESYNEMNEESPPLRFLNNNEPGRPI